MPHRRQWKMAWNNILMIFEPSPVLFCRFLWVQHKQLSLSLASHSFIYLLCVCLCDCVRFMLTHRESKRNQKPFKSLSGQKDGTTISKMENEEKNTKILTEKIYYKFICW